MNQPVMLASTGFADELAVLQRYLKSEEQAYTPCSSCYRD